MVIYEPDKSDGERVQQVDIYLNFIGKFEVPEPEPTPEELAEMEKLRQKPPDFSEIRWLTHVRFAVAFSKTKAR